MSCVACMCLSHSHTALLLHEMWKCTHMQSDTTVDSFRVRASVRSLPSSVYYVIQCKPLAHQFHQVRLPFSCYFCCWLPGAIDQGLERQMLLLLHESVNCVTQCDERTSCHALTWAQKTTSKTRERKTMLLCCCMDVIEKFLHYLMPLPVLLHSCWLAVMKQETGDAGTE